MSYAICSNCGVIYEILPNVNRLTYPGINRGCCDNPVGFTHTEPAAQEWLERGWIPGSLL